MLLGCLIIGICKNNECCSAARAGAGTSLTSSGAGATGCWCNLVVCAAHRQAALRLCAHTCSLHPCHWQSRTHSAEKTQRAATDKRLCCRLAATSPWIQLREGSRASHGSSCLHRGQPPIPERWLLGQVQIVFWSHPSLPATAVAACTEDQAP